MGKGIDFDAIQQEMLENPGDWWSPEEAERRTNAALKRALNVLTTEEEDELLRDQCKRLGW